MIIGAHSIIYSKNPDADRAFLRDMLGLPSVDVGKGWLVFGLPPAVPRDRKPIRALPARGLGWRSAFSVAGSM
jgi:hypothetical protein